MAISEKKLQANRMNSLKARQKSTGPKNFERTRFNAVKHGMASLQPIILPSEDEGEFRKLYQDTNDTFLPKDMIEERLVHQIALCLWRLRRGIAAEQAIFREYSNLNGVNWSDLLKTNCLEKITRYERRIMNHLGKLIDRFKNCSKNKALHD